MYAVIDMGSNTIRLSIYKKQEQTISLILHKKTMAGLIGYVDKQGNMSMRGIEVAIETLNNYKSILQHIQVENVYVFATASLRNIKNTQEAIYLITKGTGYPIDLVSGVEEGVYDFIGVTCLMDVQEGLVVDIGGGSSELVSYQDGRILQSISVPIGSLNLYKQFVDEILPTPTEIENMRQYIASLIQEVSITGSFEIISGVGGSIRGCHRINNYLQEKFKETISEKQLKKIIKKCCGDRKKATSMMLKVCPERLHTIIPGLLILECIVKHFNSKKIIVSSYGVREGYLYTKLFLNQ